MPNWAEDWRTKVLFTLQGRFRLSLTPDIAWREPVASWTFSNLFFCPDTCSVFRGVQEYLNSELKSGGFVFDPVWQLLSQTPMIPANARVWPCWNFQGFTRSISALRNNPKKMLSALFNQPLMKALEISLSGPWLCSTGKGQRNIWAHNSTGEVANESHGIECFGKTTEYSEREVRFWQWPEHRRAPGIRPPPEPPRPGGPSTLAQSSADTEGTAENCSCSVPRKSQVLT